MEKTIEKPKSTVNSSAFSRIIFDEKSGCFKVKKITRTYNWDSVNQKRLGRKPISERIELLPLSVLGDSEPVKSIVIPCLIRKTGYDSLLNEISVYVKRNLQIRIIEDPIYSGYYLVKDSTGIHRLPFKVYLPTGFTAPVQFRGTEQGVNKSWTSEESLVSDSEFAELKDKALMLVRKGKDYELAGISVG